jgi:hypothetical protein
LWPVIKTYAKRKTLIIWLYTTARKRHVQKLTQNIFFLVNFFSKHSEYCYKILLFSPSFFYNYTKFRKNRIKWPGHYPTPKISKLYMLNPYEDSRTLVLIFCFWWKNVIWVGQGWKLCYFFSFLVFSIFAICFKFTLKIWKFTKNSKKICCHYANFL